MFSLSLYTFRSFRKFHWRICSNRSLRKDGLLRIDARFREATFPVSGDSTETESDKTSQGRGVDVELTNNDVSHGCLDDSQIASLYVHWPYCQKRCSYCNFNKYISNDVDEERMERCLVREAETLIKLSGVKRIDSVFFGGGTPSLAPVGTLGRVLETVARHVYFPTDAEISIEVNPTPAATVKLREFRLAGINRLSIGIQSLKEQTLRDLNRDHTTAQSLSCIRHGKELFPSRLSVDMIFGLPGQTVNQWTEELYKLLPLLEGHISLYQLTVERGTKLFKEITSGEYSLPEEDVVCDMYTSAVEILQHAGLDRYEVSNFAKQGCESKHNKCYWEGKQYIGIGPGAHGRFTPVESGGDVKQARIQTLEPANWMYEVERRGHGTRKAVDLSQVDILGELLMTGLRTREGITHQRWKKVSHDTSYMKDVFKPDFMMNELLDSEHLILDNEGLRATPSGILKLNSLLPHILASVQSFYSTRDEQKFPYFSEDNSKS